MNWRENIDIVLASASPRRAQLLEEMGFRFEVHPSTAPEMKIEGRSPRLGAIETAKAKATDVARQIGDDEKMILSADTIVVQEGVVMGKPKDAKEAYSMLARLSGKRHEVITAVCLIYKGKEYSFASSTSVLFRELVHDEVTYYIEHYKPFDKAGAYAIQEWIGRCKIAEITGSYTNVMGLPTEKVYTFIRNLVEMFSSNPSEEMTA